MSDVVRSRADSWTAERRIARLSAIDVTVAVPVTARVVPRGAWDERGWTQREEKGKTIYEGDYLVRIRDGSLRRFAGRVEVSRGIATPFVADPPSEIRRHPHGPCFQLVGGGPWFKCHWHVPARTQDDAITYVERVLSESLEGRT